MRLRRMPLPVTRARTWRRPLLPARVVLVPIPVPADAGGRGGLVPPVRTAAHRSPGGSTAR